LPMTFGAGEESRTLDLNLGKVALYQLSYSRFASLRRHQQQASIIDDPKTLSRGNIVIYDNVPERSLIRGQAFFR
jgi:hypothetical protein